MKRQRNKRDLDNYEYDAHLARKKKYRELQDRTKERKNKGYKGWHFGLGDHPVHAKSKKEFDHKLKRRGLVMKDKVHKKLRR